MLRLLPLALLATLTWYALSSVAAGPAPQAACSWPCGGVATAFSPGGGAALAGLPAPAQVLGLPGLVAGAEAAIRSALP